MLVSGASERLPARRRGPAQSHWQRYTRHRPHVVHRHDPRTFGRLLGDERGAYGAPSHVKLPDVQGKDETRPRGFEPLTFGSVDRINGDDG